jgi:hypothetical protein
MSILKSKHSGWTWEGKRTPMGGGKGGGAPPPPDYAGAAAQTAAGNLEATRAATKANRVNQITPYGSLTYTQSQTPTFNADAYRTALDAYNQARQSYQPQTDEYGNVVNPMTMTAPNYADFMTQPDPDSGWTATQTLSPAQQQLLDYQNQTSMGLGKLAGQGLGYVENMLNTPFDTSRLAELQSRVSPADMQRFTGQANLGQMSDAERQLRAGQAPNLQTSIGQNAGMEGWDRASNLMMQRLDPQMQRQSERLDAQLAAQGIPLGSEAYTRAKQDLAMQQNDLRTQAQLQAQNVQQNLFGQELQAGQFGNQAMLGQNQAQLANLGFTNQAQQADFANQLAGMGFNNQQIQQMYQNQQAQQQANNAIGQQEYANRMAGANLSNQARQQGLQEQAYLRNEPLNTLSAVRTGSQVTGPQFVNSFNQATTQGADLLGAQQMGYNAQMGAYNAQQAGQNSMTSGLMGLAGAGVMAY